MRLTSTTLMPTKRPAFHCDRALHMETRVQDLLLCRD